MRLCRRKMQTFLKTGLVVGVLTAMIWGSVWLVMLERKGGGGPLMDAGLEMVSKFIDLTPIGLSPGRSPRDPTKEELEDLQAQLPLEGNRKEEVADKLDEQKIRQQDKMFAEQTRRLEEQWLEEQRKLAIQKRKEEGSKLAEEKKREEAKEANKRMEKANIAEQKRIAKVAEEKRIEEEAKVAEEKRIAEEAKVAEEKRIAEEAKVAEEKRIAEEAKVAEEKRIAEEAKVAEEKRIEEAAKQDEQKRLEEVKLAEQKRMEEKAKLAEQKQIEEAAKFAQKKRIAEETKQKQMEEAKLSEQKQMEKAKLAEQKQIEEVAKLAEQKRNEEAFKQDKQKRLEVKLAEQKPMEERAKLAEQKQIEEAAKLATQKQIAEEAKVAEQKQIEETKLAEQKKIVEKAKLAEQKRIKVEAKIAEQKKEDEDKQVQQQRMDAPSKVVKQKKNDELRQIDQNELKQGEHRTKDMMDNLVEEKKKTEQQARLDEQKRKEAILTEQKRMNHQRLAQERLRAEKQKIEEFARREAEVREKNLRTEKLVQQRREEQEKIQADFRKEQMERLSKVKFVIEEKKLDDERRADEIGKAQADIEAYSEKQALGNNHGVDNPDIHLALVACGDRLPESMILLKSARMFSRVHLHFHVFAEEELKPMFKEQLAAWPEDVKKRTTFDIQSLRFPPENAAEWKKLFKTCASQRLFLPDLLPTLDAVIYLDTDILFMRPPEDLWRFFRRFNSSQIAALAPEHEDANIGWYNRFARHPYYPPLGVNSGVMLMNLTRMRTVKWVEAMIPYHNEYKYRITWGDQDLINIYFHFRPEMLYIYPCHWNFRPDHCMYMSICTQANKVGANIVHGNRRVWFNDKQPAFKAIYEAFMKYKFGDGLEEGLLRLVRENMGQSAVHATNCGKDQHVLIRQLQTQVALTKASTKPHLRAAPNIAPADSGKVSKGLGPR